MNKGTAGYTLLSLTLVISLAAFTFEGDDDSRYIKGEESFTVDLGGIDTVKFENLNGYIKVTLGSANRLDIKISEKVKISDKYNAAELLDEAKVVHVLEENTLIVYIDYGKFKNSKLKGNYVSSYDVVLPSRLNIECLTTNGSITAPAFDGSVSLMTTNGSIASQGSGSIAELTTTNGSISLKNATGAVEAATTNGSIKIYGGTGPIEAETINGSVKVELTAGLKGDVELSTVNGDIELFSGSGGDFSVEANTLRGKVRIHTDSVEYNKKKTAATATFGSGTYSVELQTVNGSITVK